MEKLFILIIEGTTRPKRESLKAAQFIFDIGKGIEEIEVQLVSPEDFHLPYDGNDDENRDPNYTALTKKADGFFVIVPEYNHSFPGTLKRLLDSELDNYIHKPVAFAGVSSGLWGGTRGIEQLVVSVREMGLIPTFTDMHFPRVQHMFDESGKIIDEKNITRVEKAFAELIWMTKVMKYGRENIVSEYHEPPER